MTQQIYILYIISFLNNGKSSCTRGRVFLGGSIVYNPLANAGDASLIHRLGRSPAEGNGNPLQYSCLENPWTEEPGGLQSTVSQRIRHD